MVVLQVLLQHFLAGGSAILAGFFGPRVVGWFSGVTRAKLAARIVVAIAGLTMVLGTPPPLAGWGLYGFVNELLGREGVPVALGGIAPPFTGLALGLRWAFQLLLVGTFSVAIGLAPRAVPSSDARPMATPTAGP